MGHFTADLMVMGSNKIQVFCVCVCVCVYIILPDHIIFVQTSPEQCVTGCQV